MNKKEHMLEIRKMWIDEYECNIKKLEKDSELDLEYQDLLEEYEKLQKRIIRYNKEILNHLRIWQINRQKIINTEKKLLEILYRQQEITE